MLERKNKDAKIRAQEVTIKTKEAQLQECYREISSLKEEKIKDDSKN